MSWKSFVTAGLLCVVASPVFAVPTVTTTGGGTQTGTSGHLDPNGNWVWLIQVGPTSPLVDPTGTPLATELGFRETSSRNIVGSATIADAAVGDTPNPGGSDAMQQEIFPAWEVSEDVDPGAGVNLRPTGLKTNNPTDEVASYFGSDIITATGQTNYVRIEVQGPQTTDANVDSLTTLQMLGAYGGMGRIAELDAPGAGGVCAFDSCNYDQYAGSVTRRARAGDVNLDGSISGGDFGVLQTNFTINDGQRKWYHGDFNGDGDVSGGDFSFMQQNFGETYSVGGGAFAGAGGGSSLGAVATPEPASVALLALAGLGLAGLRFRKRS